MYMGTTGVAIYRGSGALSLAGVSIDGAAGSVTNATFTTAFTNQGGAGVLAWPAAGATLTIPTGGGTLGTAAFTAATAYAAASHNQVVSTISDSTTVGRNLVKLTNPSAIRFLRVNADNTVTALTAADFRTATGTAWEVPGTIGSTTPNSGVFTTGSFTTSLAAPTLPIGTATTGVATSAMLDSMVPSCMGDGATVTFLHDGVRPVYRKDWQGVQLLYTTARTNLCKQSENLVTTWAPRSGTLTVAATTLDDTDSGVVSARQQTFAVANDSTPYCLSCLVAKSAPNLVMVRATLSGGTVVPSAIVLDTVTGAWGGNTASYGAWTSDKVSVVDLGAAGWKVTVKVTNNSSGNTLLSFILYPAFATTLAAGSGDTAAVVSLTGAAGFTKMQVETGLVPTSYIPTTTAAVTVTDYATTGGVATLAEAPLAGSILYGVSDRPRVLGAAIADATSEADAVTKLNLLLAEMRTQGKIAT